MYESRIRSIDQVRDSVFGTLDALFHLPAVEPQERNRARGALISEVAHRFGYCHLRRRGKSLILRYVALSYRLQRRPGRTPCALTCTGL